MFFIKFIELSILKHVNFVEKVILGLPELYFTKRESATIAMGGYYFAPMYKLFIKRLIDFFVALAGLIILCPFIIILMVILFFVNNGKPFFFQSRPGKKEKKFKIIKFKTMRDFEPNSSLDIHSPKRITKIGAFIRKYSFDEVLQLVNVLKGDMSLVGPRPLLTQYLPLYNGLQRKRHDVLPGITGWAQVNGRNALAWDEKFRYDVYYVENLSLILDIQILIKTFLKVVKKEGVNQGEETIMPVWKGNQDQKQMSNATKR